MRTNILRQSAFTAQRNFKVVKAKSAQIKAAIQKRAMIFDSFQPNNSK
jgi:hypothetical protein